MWRRSTIGIGILFVFIQGTVWGLTIDTPQRPKIGLALSGGGARGFAHIGVLEWLDQNRIPIDYVAGTSMGGLIGALYATGMRPADIKREFEAIDWDDIFRGEPRFDQLGFQRKEERRIYPNAIEIGYRDGLRLPRGLNSGHLISLILNRITLPYSSISSFDDLPIPFRCVATDMVTAKSVVLKDGSLSQALRATMAIPGIFTPVKQGDLVLADGGLLNNLPTDVVRQMGADIVIAVDVGTPLGNSQSLESLSGMISQSINVMTIQNVWQSYKLADICILPDLGDRSLLDFEEWRDTSQQGLEAAKERARVLEQFAVSESEWMRILEDRETRRRRATPAPTSLQVEAPNGEIRDRIRQQLTHHLGQPLSLQSLEVDLTRMTGQGRFDSVEYEIRDQAGADQLFINAKPKAHGPPFIRLSIDVNNARSDHTDFTLRSRLTYLDVGKSGSEWRTDWAVGSRLAATSEYQQPIAGGSWFVTPRAFYDKNTDDLFLDGSRVAEYRVRRAGVGFDVGYEFGPRSEIRLGYELGHTEATVIVGQPILPDLDGVVRRASLRWIFDGQDSAVIPTKGIRAITQTEWFFKSPGSDEGFPMADFRISSFIPVRKKGSIFLLGSGGTTFGKQAPPEQEFTLGGPFRLGAFSQNEFRGSHFLYGSLGYLRQIYQLPLLLGGKVYTGMWYEAGSAFHDRRAAGYIQTVSGGVVMETKLGPVFFGGSWGTGNRGKVYFAIGRFF